MDDWIRTHLTDHPTDDPRVNVDVVLDRDTIASGQPQPPFRTNSLRDVVLPPSLTSLERYAFMDNNLPESEVESIRANAAANIPSAQSRLGSMYADGLGVLQDDREAVGWFTTAAEAGDASAQNNLGVMYATGRGVLQDDSAAFRWFESAAEQRNLFAQNNLGVMYANGRGVEQDYVLAHKWLNLAGAGGYVGALELREVVAEEMSTEDLQAALAAAREQEALASP